MTLLWCEKLHMICTAFLSKRVAACLCAMAGSSPAEHQISNRHVQAACWARSTTCTWRYFLCNANNLFSTNELIPFLFPFLSLCPSVTVLLPLTSIPIQRMQDESQMLLLLPDWKLKSPKGLLCHQETCFFLIVTYPSLDQLSLRNLFFPWDLAISCPINSSSF